MFEEEGWAALEKIKATRDASEVIGFEIVGWPAFQKITRRRAQMLKNRRKVNERAIVVVDQWIQKNFKSEGELAQNGWQSLESSTLKHRRKKGKGAKILQDTGQLRSRWKHDFSSNHAVLQSGVDYGVFHDSDKPRKKLPQRKILPRNKQIWPELKKIYKHFIRRALS